MNLFTDEHCPNFLKTGCPVELPASVSTEAAPTDGILTENLRGAAVDLMLTLASQDGRRRRLLPFRG